MKTLLALTVAVLTASCANQKVRPPSQLPTIPRATVVKEVREVSNLANQVGDQTSVLKDRIGSAKRRGDDAVASVGAAEKELARLASQDAITRAELATANKMWGKAYRDVIVMQDEVVRANETINNMAHIAQALRQQATASLVSAVDAEGKLEQAKTQLEAKKTEADTYFTASQELRTRVAVLEAQNGKLKAWLYWIIGFLLVYLLVRYLKWRYNLLRFIP